MAIYMIWFLATAVMIVTVLTIGTLAAADLLPKRTHPHTRGTSDPVEPDRAVHAARGDTDEQRHCPERADAA